MNSKMDSKKRFLELDILKGIGILLMVFDHVGWGMTIHTYIQSFHMPLFFVVSGFLYKKSDIKSVIEKKYKTLMRPYWIFAIGYLAMKIILLLYTRFSKKEVWNTIIAVCLYPSDINHMPFAPALWFLPCMFITNILYSVISKYASTMKEKGIIVGIITVCGVLYEQMELPMLPWTIETVATAIFFWYMGELISNNYFVLSKLLNKKIIVLIIWSISIILAFTNGCVDMRSARYYVAPLYLLNGVLGTIAYWGIAIQLSSIKTISIKIKKLISYFSINAMAYLCMNQFFIMLVNSFLNRILLNSYLNLYFRNFIVFLVVLILCTAINILIKKFNLNFILGR